MMVLHIWCDDTLEYYHLFDDDIDTVNRIMADQSGPDGYAILDDII